MSAEPASTSASNDDPSKTEMAGIIAGSLIAGIAFLLGLIGVVFYTKRRKRSDTAQTSNQDAQDNDHNSSTLRNSSMSIEPGVRGMWAAPEHLRSPVQTITSTAPLNLSNPPEPPQKGGIHRATSPSGGYIKPFFLNEGQTTRSPVSPSTSANRDDTSTYGSHVAPSEHEGPASAQAQALARTSDEPAHGDDPNGSESYEMTRWGKQIKQTNMI